jgi:hypothetical protein
MLRGTFAGRTALLNDTMNYWLFTGVGVFIGIALLTIGQSPANKWSKSLDRCGKGMIYATLVFQAVWIAVLTGG